MTRHTKTSRQRTARLKSRCNLAVGRKIRKLRREGVPQNVAVARGFSQTRQDKPECRRFIRKSPRNRK